MIDCLLPYFTHIEYKLTFSWSIYSAYTPFSDKALCILLFDAHGYPGILFPVSAPCSGIPVLGSFKGRVIMGACARRSSTCALVGEQTVLNWDAILGAYH